MDYHLLTKKCDGMCDSCECPPATARTGASDMTKPSADKPSGQPLGLPLNDWLGAGAEARGCDNCGKRGLARAKAEQEYSEYMHAQAAMDDDWDGEWEPRDTTCSHCSGTGGDPWNDGITPCEHCDGEGYEWWN